MQLIKTVTGLVKRQSWQICTKSLCSLSASALNCYICNSYVTKECADSSNETALSNYLYSCTVASATKVIGMSKNLELLNSTTNRATAKVYCTSYTASYGKGFQ